MRIRLWTILKPLLILVVIIAIPFAFYLLSQLGPKPLDELTYSGEAGSSEELAALLDEVDRLEEKFESVVILRQPTEEDLLILREAKRMLDEAQTLSMGFNPELLERRDEIQKEFDEGMARILSRELARLEESADSLRESGDLTQAQRELRRAYQVQLRINSDFPMSTFVDVGRATRLSREITFIESEPLYLESVSFQERAEEAYAAGRWTEAAEFLRRAIQTQERLNQEFRNTQRASMIRLAELEAREITFSSARVYGEKEALVEQAEKFAEEENWAAAANAFDEARRVQRDINTHFPTSGFASNEEVILLEVRRQTVLSAELFLRIKRQVSELDAILEARRTAQAEELVAVINRDLDDLRTRFSRHQHDAEDLELKIAYLNVIRTRIGQIQDEVYVSLVPMPEDDSLTMAQTEIPQRLFSTVMGSNPSLQIGSKRPVNAVSYEEANIFCQRLSWILGREVRLPTREEFRKAVGTLRFVKLEEIANARPEDAERAPLKDTGSLGPNRNGFYDLLGNVREWLSRDSGNTLSERTWTAGGSAQDPYSTLVQVPMTETSVNTVDPFIGFRIVVN